MGTCNAKPCLAYEIPFTGKRSSCKQRSNKDVKKAKKKKRNLKKRDSETKDIDLDTQLDFKSHKGSNYDFNFERSNFICSSKMFGTGKLISVYDLYNILNDGAHRPYIQDPMHLIVIDSRDLSSFSISHVVTAKHHNEVMGNMNCSGSLSKYGIVVLYGPKLSSDQSCHNLTNLMKMMEDYVACDILILQTGFSIFEGKYPYLCTDREVESISDRRLLICYPSVVIEDILYQGRGDQATNRNIIDILGITHIVNISEHRNAFPQKVKYLKLPLDDLTTTNLFQHFEKTSCFINDALTRGGHVLVHCNLGVSRSSTVTLAYLMKHKGWNLGDAFSFLRNRRTCACPNAGFLSQLSDWEYELNGKRYTDVSKMLN